MHRIPYLAAALAVSVVSAASAASSPEPDVARLVAQSARWLGGASGFSELRKAGVADRILRETVRLAMVQKGIEPEVVGRVLDPVEISTERTPRQLAQKVLARAEVLPEPKRREFLTRVAEARSQVEGAAGKAVEAETRVAPPLGLEVTPPPGLEVAPPPPSLVRQVPAPASYGPAPAGSLAPRPSLEVAPPPPSLVRSPPARASSRPAPGERIRALLEKFARRRRARDARAREKYARELRAREQRSREQRAREALAREERAREERSRKLLARVERGREQLDHRRPAERSLSLIQSYLASRLPAGPGEGDGACSGVRGRQACRRRSWQIAYRRHLRQRISARVW